MNISNQPEVVNGDHSEEVDAKNPVEDKETSVESQGYVSASYGDIAKEFVLLGWTAFGGPAAHIGLFQKVRVILNTSER